MAALPPSYREAHDTLAPPASSWTHRPLDPDGSLVMAAGTPLEDALQTQSNRERQGNNHRRDHPHPLAQTPNRAVDQDMARPISFRVHLDRIRTGHSRRTPRRR